MNKRNFLIHSVAASSLVCSCSPVAVPKNIQPLTDDMKPINPMDSIDFLMAIRAIQDHAARVFMRPPGPAPVAEKKEVASDAAEDDSLMFQSQVIDKMERIFEHMNNLQAPIDCLEEMAGQEIDLTMKLALLMNMDCILSFSNNVRRTRLAFSKVTWPVIGDTQFLPTRFLEKLVVLTKPSQAKTKETLTFIFLYSALVHTSSIWDKGLKNKKEKGSSQFLDLMEIQKQYFKGSVDEFFTKEFKETLLFYVNCFHHKPARLDDFFRWVNQ